MIGESLCDLEAPSWTLETLLGIKTEWLITDVRASKSPVRAEHDFWGGDISAISGRFVFGEPLCDTYGNPLMSPNLKQSHLMKIEQLIKYR